MARTLLARVCVLLLPLRPVAYISSSVRLAARPRARAMAARVEMSAGLKRVVVTGMGITSCLGNTLEDVKKSLYDAEPGITFNEKYAELGLRSHVCGRPEIAEDEYKEVIDRKNMRFMGMNAKYAYLAMDRAIKDSGMEASDYQNPRAGGILGQVRRRDAKLYYIPFLAARARACRPSARDQAPRPPPLFRLPFHRSRVRSAPAGWYLAPGHHRDGGRRARRQDAPGWPVPRDSHDGQHRVRRAHDGVQASGHLVLDFLGVLDGGALHRHGDGAGAADVPPRPLSSR